MSRQTSMEAYYKTKSSASPPSLIGNNITKKRNLSLIRTKTPEKIKKPSPDCTQNESNVIDLCSDDDKSPLRENKFNISQDSIKSESSDAFEGTLKPPSTPKKSPSPSSSYYQSPNKRSSSVSQSPSKRLKFFSPTKKRAVFKTPIKRNLTKQLGDFSPQKSAFNDEDFAEACLRMDDKSIFLLTIINKFRKNDKLRVLMDEPSQEILNNCLHLVKPGIKLVCRLYWRQHTWYQVEQLKKICSNKDKVISGSDFDEMLACLVQKGLITESTASGEDSMTFDDLSKVLKSGELQQICKDLKIKMGVKKKEDAIDALRNYSRRTSIAKYFNGKNTDNSARVLDMLRSKTGKCYKLSSLAIHSLYQLYVLMYLGINYSVIREKTLELALINMKTQTEVYPVDLNMELDDASVVFNNREEFAKYLKAHVMYENYLAETNPSEKCRIVRQTYQMFKDNLQSDCERYESLPTWLHRYSASYLFIKILENGVQELKKDRNDGAKLALNILSDMISQDLFRRHKKPEWIAEEALILHKILGRYDEAAEALIEGLINSDFTKEAKDVICTRAIKLVNQLNIQLGPHLKEQLIRLTDNNVILESSFAADHVLKSHMENSGTQRGKKKFEVFSPSGKQYLDAEDYCILHYTSSGDYTHGQHWEGRIITTIFYLLFWEIIYSKPRGVLGVFLCHLQRDPLDLYTDEFYTNRKDVIDDWLQTIRDADVERIVDIMYQTWSSRPEQELSGINRSIGWDNIRSVVVCLGAARLAALCHRLAHNYHYSHSGFPDLTLWNENTGQIKFVEVKTDTDKPSRKQLQWLQYLNQHGIDAGFCYVGSNTTRVRARAGNHAKINLNKVNLNENSKISMENSVSGMENSVSGMENSVSGMENSVSGMENSVSGMENSVSSAGKSVRFRKNNTRAKGKVKSPRNSVRSTRNNVRSSRNSGKSSGKKVRLSENSFSSTENSLSSMENSKNLMEDSKSFVENSVCTMVNDIDIEENSISFTENSLIKVENNYKLEENSVIKVENNVNFEENSITQMENSVSLAENSFKSVGNGSMLRGITVKSVQDINNTVERDIW